MNWKAKRAERLKAQRQHAKDYVTAVQVVFCGVSLTPDAAEIIEDALQEGFDNCGQDPNCLWAEPLALIKLARGK